MFQTLRPQPADKIIALMDQFRADPRAGKVDLGVGVYKDAEGRTPVMRAVREAGRRLWEAETTKSYTALAGDPAFMAAMTGLVLGKAAADDRTASVATVGGTGAIRQALELLRRANPALRVWVSDPTWPNHLSILTEMGIETHAYRYFDPETKGVDFAAMLKDLRAAGAGDVVLLHGCCHNPTGANLTPPEWTAVAELLEGSGAIPLVDLAYQGFGDGLDADAAAARMLATRLPEVLIAASCSKNFGIYRERTGILIARASDSARRDLVQANLVSLNRLAYSFPPDHGARLVTEILTSADLRADWEAELEAVRRGMIALREKLAAELARLSGSNRFGFIAQHRGMFSRLGASPEQVERMRAEHGIYMIGDSRINVAGLNDRTVPILARAMIATGI
jgi:aromatic-amino-acid transaminase